MKYIDLGDTLLVELARECQERGVWFAEPVAQACVYLFQQLVSPELGYEYYWHSNDPRSAHLSDSLEYARGKGWLVWHTDPAHSRASYRCTELGLRFRMPSFAKNHAEQLSHLLGVLLPDKARGLARVQYFLDRYGSEKGFKRLSELRPRAVDGWDEASALLADLKRSGCRPQVPA